MPVAPIPPPFEYVGGRRFAFYPPIRRIESNEWTFRGASWSEILVRHAASGRDLWIPRRYVHESADLGHQTVVICLSEQLELQNGSVLPRSRCVIEMPVRSHDAQSAPTDRAPAKVIGIRLEHRTESRAGRIAGGAVALGVLGCLAVVGYSWQGETPGRAVFSSLDKTYLALNGADTAQSVEAALGAPEWDRWVTTPNGERLHLLSYPDRGFRAVLRPDGVGGERYIGAVDEDGRTLQSVLSPEGFTSALTLRGLAEL